MSNSEFQHPDEAYDPPITPSAGMRPKDLRTVVRDYLRHRADRTQYVKLHHIQTATGVESTQRIAAAMRTLTREGTVERWSGGTPATWIINEDDFDADLYESQ